VRPDKVEVRKAGPIPLHLEYGHCYEPFQGCSPAAGYASQQKERYLTVLRVMEVFPVLQAQYQWVSQSKVRAKLGDFIIYHNEHILKRNQCRPVVSEIG
jgi:hypothetical protein